MDKEEIEKAIRKLDKINKNNRRIIEGKKV